MTRLLIALAIGIASQFSLLASAVAAEAITDDNVAAMVTAAKTAADHQALAEYFRAEAKEAETLAQKHRGMKLSHSQKGGSVWDAHCTRLIKRYEDLAGDYRTLASEQDGMAKAAAAQ